MSDIKKAPDRLVQRHGLVINFSETELNRLTVDEHIRVVRGIESEIRCIINEIIEASIRINNDVTISHCE